MLPEPFCDAQLRYVCYQNHSVMLSYISYVGCNKIIIIACYSVFCQKMLLNRLTAQHFGASESKMEGENKVIGQAGKEHKIKQELFLSSSRCIVFLSQNSYCYHIQYNGRYRET
jgi:uncharacterized Zn-finger protein